MPAYTSDGNQVIQAMSAWPEYMFGVPSYDFASNTISYGPETVTANETSRCVCLAPTSEGHGVRGFIATVIWPAGTGAGEIEVQGADQNEEAAYHVLGTISFPAVQYSSPSGLVTNFMRVRVAVLPDTPQLAARLTIR